jgi:hypothetical protein
MHLISIMIPEVSFKSKRKFGNTDLLTEMWCLWFSMSIHINDKSKFLPELNHPVWKRIWKWRHFLAINVCIRWRWVVIFTLPPLYQTNNQIGGSLGPRDGLSKILVGIEVVTAMIMKSPNFWDITFCSPLKVNRRFGGTCRLHLQSRRISQARIEHEAGSKYSWRCTCQVSPKRR